MPNITPRRNKNGEIISYRIRVARGYDSKGEKLKPYEMTWKPAPGMTKKQIEKELNRQAVTFEENCKNGRIGNQNMKLAEFCAMYLEIKKDALAPRILHDYERAINNLIIPKLGHIKLSELKPAHVQQFVHQLQSQTKKDSKGKAIGKVSPSTVKRKLACLQSILKQAVKLDIITSNPADASRLTLPKVVAPKVEIFTKQEAAEMLSCLEKEPLQFQVLVQLAIMTGARCGELVGLKFSDIDFKANKITIERSAYKLPKQPIMTKPPKDYEVRTVTVNSYCIELIKLLRAEKNRQAMELGTAWHEGDWLFTQWDGTILNPQTPSKQFSDFLKKNGLRHRKFHSLRLTSATLLLYGGVNVRQVQERLGHGNIKTTNIYLHCVAEADEEAANVLQDMLITHTKNEQAEEKQQQTG